MRPESLEPLQNQRSESHLACLIDCRKCFQRRCGTGSRARKGHVRRARTRSRDDSDAEFDGPDARPRANAWQIVSTAFDNVLGWSGRDGAEIIAVAQVAQGITLPVYVRPEIKTWEDLRGKPLAVDAVDTAYALVLRRVLLAHGLDMERGDYTLVPRARRAIAWTRWHGAKLSLAC